MVCVNVLINPQQEIIYSMQGSAWMLYMCCAVHIIILRKPVFILQELDGQLLYIRLHVFLRVLAHYCCNALYNSYNKSIYFTRAIQLEIQGFKYNIFKYLCKIIIMYIVHQ